MDPPAWFDIKVSLVIITVFAGSLSLSHCVTLDFYGIDSRVVLHKKLQRCEYTPIVALTKLTN